MDQAPHAAIREVIGELSRARHRRLVARQTSRTEDYGPDGRVLRVTDEERAAWQKLLDFGYPALANYVDAICQGDVKHLPTDGQRFYAGLLLEARELSPESSGSGRGGDLPHQQLLAMRWRPPRSSGGHPRLLRALVVVAVVLALAAYAVAIPSATLPAEARVLDIAFYCLFIIGGLVFCASWVIHIAKIIPYVSRFRETKPSEVIPNCPQYWYVMGDYKRLCLKHGGNMRWYVLDVWLAVPSQLLMILAVLLLILTERGG